MVQSKFGKWKVAESIGEGGQNRVFLVKDSTDEHTGQYALKWLKNKNRLARFDRELQARTKLKPGLVPKIVDSDTTCDKPYLVEVYYPGGNMAENRDLFEGNLLNTLRYFEQVCEVVEDAHTQQTPVVHRDLKPQNILYDRDSDRFLITDFGICFVMDQEQDERETSLNEQVGPRNFIAPELQKGQVDQVMPHSDIYSLGQLLYWMLANRILFREDHRSADYELYKVLQTRHYERIHSILDRCVTVNPSDRFASAQSLRKEVRKVIELAESRTNVIRFGVYQKCIYCKLGNYRQVVDWDPAKSGENNYYFGRKANFAMYGYRLEQRTKEKWHVAACDYCGHVILFVRAPNNNSWEDPKYLPQERDLD